MKTHCFSHILLRAAAGAVLFFSALFSLFGCTYNQRLKRVLAVEPEVPYGCAAVGEAGITVNGRLFFYEDEADRQISGQIEGYDYAHTFMDSGVFYLCTYRRGPFRQSKKAALFYMDYRSGACKLIRDFGEILSTERSGVPYPDVYRAVNERFLLFALNGRLQLFDLPSRTVVWEEKVYDPLLYTEAEAWEYPYRFGPGCYYALDDSRLSLWYFRDGTMKKLTASGLTQSDNIGFFGQYVYASHYDGGMIYDRAYDLETGQTFPTEELRALIEAEPEPDEPEAETLNFRGETLTVERTSENLRLLRADGEVFLDAESCMGQSPMLARLDEAWGTNFSPLPAEVFVREDKLILAWKSEGSMMTPESPLYLFEIDPELGPRYLGLSVGQLLLLFFL